MKKMEYNNSAHLVALSQPGGISVVVPLPQLEPTAAEQHVQPVRHPNFLIQRMGVKASAAVMTFKVIWVTSMLIRSLGQWGPTRSMRDANGCTTRLVPRMIRRSHCLKSSRTHLKNLSGRFSPKKTMSGFTTPLHLAIVQRGIWKIGYSFEYLTKPDFNLSLVSVHQYLFFDPCLRLFIKPASWRMSLPD